MEFNMNLKKGSFSYYEKKVKNGKKFCFSFLFGVD